MTASRLGRTPPPPPAYQRGDVILVPFPFAERLAEKQRPAVVMSITRYQTATGDLIVAQVASHTAAAPRPGDHSVQGWRQAGLLFPSLVRARLATIHASRVRRRLGGLPPADLEAVERGLQLVLGILAKPSAPP